MRSIEVTDLICSRQVSDTVPSVMLAFHSKGITPLNLLGQSEISPTVPESPFLGFF